MTHPPATSSSTREVHDLLRVELDRVLSRLAHLGPVRLSRPSARVAGADELRAAGAAGAGAAAPAVVPSAADLVRAVLQPLADAVAHAAGGPGRPVPVLADRAVPDQLAVLGADVLGAALPGDVLTDLAGRLTDLRRALP